MEYIDLKEEFEENIIQCRRNDIDIEDKVIRNIDLEDYDLQRLTFIDVTFENCRFIKCDFTRASFINVKFVNCDLSSSTFDKSYLSQCNLLGGKALGLTFLDGIIKNTQINDYNFMYSNFETTNFEAATIDNCDFTEASISQCNIKKCNFSKDKFIATNFFNTPLKKVDFRSSELLGIGVSQEAVELKGAIVDSYQAVELSKLLGIIIK